MTKIKSTKTSVETTISTLTEKNKTFSITKEIQALDGEHGIFILLYPTRNIDNFYIDDSTNTHIMNHLADLNFKSYTIINLFATVTQSRLSTRNLDLDKENISFIKNQIFEQIKNNKTKVIIAWGNSHITSKVVLQSKELMLKLWQEIHPDKPLYQLTSQGMKNIEGVHPLYLGIHHSNATWGLKEYPYKKAMREFNSAVKKRFQNQKNKTAKEKDSRPNIQVIGAN